jgi:hypothetical protein
VFGVGRGGEEFFEVGLPGFFGGVFGEGFDIGGVREEAGEVECGAACEGARVFGGGWWEVFGGEFLLDEVVDGVADGVGVGGGGGGGGGGRAGAGGVG